jgi:hypothetical protein
MVQALTPDEVEPSDITVRIELVGNMPAVLGPTLNPLGNATNLASPVPINNKLYLIDQNDAIYRLNGKTVQQIFQVYEAPAGLDLDNRQSIINIAPGSKHNEVFVAFTSRTLPLEPVVLYELPAPLPGVCCDVNNPTLVDDLYRLDPLPSPLNFIFGPGTRTEYQVLYRYKLAGNQLKDPEAIVAFETQSGPVHNGGAMAKLPDGRILFATGDSLPFGTDGRAAPQDDSSHLGKILIVDPDDGSVQVAAKGVRNVQHFEYVLGTDPDDLIVSFADIGGVTAEEINYVPVQDLLDTTNIENFGWGRNEDGLAREGTFYIEPGVPGVFGTEPPASGVAPVPDPGFIQPHAQFGRASPYDFVAVSGPVTSIASFDTITGLFGDLPSGKVFATLDPITDIDVTVYEVNIVDADGISTSLWGLAGGRPDPRFFRFPDGTAGVLLEKTGDFYRLSQGDND